jgi:two-component sensor histidine kinase
MAEAVRCLNVLLVEDSESDARLILHRIAQAGYQTMNERVENAEQLAQALKEGSWDVVLSDHSLPEFNAAEALLILQRSGMDLPFIVVSGAIGEETAVRLMKAGAHDYIMKTNLARLVPAIEREIEEAGVRREKSEAEEKVRASLREKEVMLKEIHHRVKNNLQIMTSLLNLQQHRIADTGIRELFAATQRRIRSMALVHEKLYHSSDLAVIAMEDYVHAIAEELLRAVGKPGVVISSAKTDVSMGVDHAIPCGLILNELLTNSLMHGFPDGRTGEIAVSVTREGPDVYLLVVRDNGVGFPATFDMKLSDTLGLLIIRSLVDQLDGSYETVNNGGAMTVVRFPIR